MHVIAAKAEAFFEALQPDFKVYQQQVLNNATAMAEQLVDRGYAIVSGGTHNHMFLVDLTKQDITGKDAEDRLGQACITVNKNSIPNDPRSPFETSGLRLGSPAMTTRGFTESEAKMVANWIADLLDHMDDVAVLERVSKEVAVLCARFPVYT